MRKFFGVISLLRLHNIAAAVLSVWVGFSMTGSSKQPWLVMAASAFAAAAGNVINDICDVAIDSINRPHRPIPARLVGLKASTVLYVVMVAGALFSAVALDEIARGWIFVWVLLLHFYSTHLKRMCLVGNAVVAGIAASGFLLGAHCGGDMLAGALPAAFAFAFIVGREIVKDADDLMGDIAQGARTFPIVAGKKKALTAAAGIFAALCVLIPLPTVFGLYSKTYVATMAASVIPILLVSMVMILRERSLTFVGSLLKIGMFFGCAAFYFAKGR